MRILYAILISALLFSCKTANRSTMLATSEEDEEENVDVFVPVQPFGTGKPILKRELVQIVIHNVLVLQKYPARCVEVAGYTEKVGASIFNLKLARDRADTVRSMLIELGIAAQRIRIKAVGDDYEAPDSVMNTREGRQRYRKVEFKWCPCDSIR